MNDAGINNFVQDNWGPSARVFVGLRIQGIKLKRGIYYSAIFNFTSNVKFFFS